MRNATCDDTQQIVMPPGHVMAFHHFGNLASAIQEPLEVGPAVVGQRHFREYDNMFAKLGERQPGTIRADQSDALQPLYALQTGTGRQADDVSEREVCGPAIMLQMREDPEVDRIEHIHFVPSLRFGSVDQRLGLFTLPSCIGIFARCDLLIARDLLTEQPFEAQASTNCR